MAMELVRTFSQLEQNLHYFDSEEIRGGREHKDFVKRGTCFVAYDSPHGVAFAPSRFVGYVENAFDKHAQNRDKDGRDTNPAISEILSSEPKPNGDLEREYEKFCNQLGLKPNAAGSFGVERKYWDLRKSR